MASIVDVFKLCQESTKTDPYVTMLKRLYSDANHKDFIKEFCRDLIVPITATGRDHSINRIFHVVAKFGLSLNQSSTDSEDMHPFLHDLFHFLLRVSGSENYAVRLHALLLMNKVLKEMAELACDEYLMQEMYTMASERLKDQSATVRAEAVLAVRYLQDPTDPECQITKDFIFLMNHDPNHITRRNITEMIAITRLTLPHFKKRLFDNHPSVRHVALNRMSDKISYRCFTLSERISIFKRCYKDPKLRPLLQTKLLPAWFKEKNNNFEQFLSIFDIPRCEDTMKDVLFMLFELQNSKDLVEQLNLEPESHLVPMEKLNNESVFLWNCLCKYIQTKKDEELDLLDVITPTVADFCTYYESYIATIVGDEVDTIVILEKTIEHIFILQQLLTIAGDLDYSDAFGMKRMRELTLKLLKEPVCMVETLEIILQRLRDTYTNQEEYFLDMVNMSTDLGYSVLSGTNTRNVFLLRSLKIVFYGMKIAHVSSVIPELQECKNSVIMPALHVTTGNLKSAALEVLCAYCALDIEEARRCFVHFLHAVHTGEEEVASTALMCAFDILTHFGSKFGESVNVQDYMWRPDSSPITPLSRSFTEENLFQMYFDQLTPYIHSKNSSLRSVAAKGAAKMMLWGRISSASVLTQLFLMCYNPLYDDDRETRTYLTAFLPAYATSKHLKPQCLINTFVKSLNYIFDSDVNEVFTDVDPYLVGVALVQLSRLVETNMKCQQGCIFHDEFALKILEKMRLEKEVYPLIVLSKILNSLQVTEKNTAQITSLAEKIAKKRLDKQVIKNVKKFLQSIKSVESSIITTGEETTQQTNMTSTTSTNMDSDVSMEVENRLYISQTNGDVTVAESVNGTDPSDNAPCTLNEGENVINEPENDTCYEAKRDSSGQAYCPESPPETEDPE